MNKATFSDAKDPKNRSKKYCVCGNHSVKAKNSKRNRKKRIRPDHRKENEKNEDINFDIDLCIDDFDDFCR